MRWRFYAPSEKNARTDLRIKLEENLNDAWYHNGRWTRGLRPLSKLYSSVAKAKRANTRDIYQPPMPVVVVGNIVVGGAGKTPLVIALCDMLRAQGWRPAVLSRGYLAKPAAFPHLISDADDADSAGDEPLLMHRRLGLPVCIDPQRTRGARFLVGRRLCDIIVCDDGLQHHKLARDQEIAVVDGERLLGNGLCLPAGPLREPRERLDEVDFVVMNGEPANESVEHDAVMQLEVDGWVNVASGLKLSNDEFLQRHHNKQFHALTGIGNPHRFFSTLARLGFNCERTTFPDHHAFDYADLQFYSDSVLLMTEKDAVKCKPFAQESHWYLSIKGVLPESFRTQIASALENWRPDSAESQSAEQKES